MTRAHGRPSAGDDDQRTMLRAVVTLDNLALLRAEVARLAAAAGLAGRASSFTLAVNEAVANAIGHGGGRGELAVIQDGQRRLIAEVVDDGPGMSEAAVALPPPQAVSGRGLWLIGELADHVEVCSDPRGTTVRLDMSLQAP